MANNALLLVTKKRSKYYLKTIEEDLDLYGGCLWGLGIFYGWLNWLIVFDIHGEMSVFSFCFKENI